MGVVTQVIGLIRITTTWILITMLPCKREESGKLNPAATDFLLFLLIVLWSGEETAGVGSNHRNAKHVHVHHASYRVAHVSPGTMIITEPMLSVFP